MLFYETQFLDSSELFSSGQLHYLATWFSLRKGALTQHVECFLQQSFCAEYKSVFYICSNQLLKGITAFKTILIFVSKWDQAISSSMLILILLYQVDFKKQRWLDSLHGRKLKTWFKLQSPIHCTYTCFQCTRGSVKINYCYEVLR